MPDEFDMQVVSDRIHRAFVEVAALGLSDAVEVEAQMQQKFAEFGLTLSAPVVGALAYALVSPQRFT